MNNETSDTFDLVRIAVMICALGSLIVVCTYFVMRAFGAGAGPGLRSLAGVLLPFVVGGFVLAFRRGVFERVAQVPPTLAFAFALGFGVVVMLLLENLAAVSAAPIAELVVASGLSLFVYTPGAVLAGRQQAGQREVWVAYYFGVVSGMLGYIVAVGFPAGGA